MCTFWSVQIMWILPRFTVQMRPRRMHFVPRSQAYFQVWKLINLEHNEFALIDTQYEQERTTNYIRW